MLPVIALQVRTDAQTMARDGHCGKRQMGDCCHKLHSLLVAVTCSGVLVRYTLNIFIVYTIQTLSNLVLIYCSFIDSCIHALRTYQNV